MPKRTKEEEEERASLIADCRETFQPHYDRPLTDDDCGRIIKNMQDVFLMLAEWRDEDLRAKERAQAREVSDVPKPAVSPPPPEPPKLPTGRKKRGRRFPPPPLPPDTWEP